jgi:hypothetical protein
LIQEFEIETTRINELNLNNTTKYTADYKLWQAEQVRFNNAKIQLDNKIDSLKVQIKTSTNQISNILVSDPTISADLSSNAISNKVKTIYRKVANRLTTNIRNTSIVSAFDRLNPAIRRISSRVPRSVRLHGGAAVGATLNIAGIVFGALMDGSFGLEPVNAVNAGIQSISNR